MTIKTYSMDTLAAETGIAARTLRSWVARRLMPKPVGKSRSARYDDRHALRARVIQYLLNEKESLQALRKRIGPLSLAELAAILPNKRAVDADGVPPPPPATSYPSTQWEEVELMSGMKLMLSTAGGPGLRRIADEIYRHYSMVEKKV